MPRVRIIPAVLAKNKTQFTKQWNKVKKEFKYVQIDIMDGILVKTKNSVTPNSVKNLTRLHKLEIHLMVKDVAKYINQWLKLKNVVKIIWHYEADKDIEAITCLNKYIKSKKVRTGLAINPNTSLSKIKDVIKGFNTIQIMGVTPGKQGQKFQNKVLKKIKALRHRYPKLNISVDGGVNDQNFKSIKKAGANIIASGNYLINSKNIKEAKRKLK